MKNKNILITCDDLGILGGSVITTIRFANALCERGWNVTILTCNSNTVEELNPRIKIEFATWFFFLSMGRNWGKVAGFSNMIIDQVIVKHDINIVLSSHFGLLGGTALFIANRKNIPSFSLCSGQVENATAGLPRLLNNFATLWVFNSLIKLYFNQAKFIIPQSYFSAELLKPLRLKAKIEVISNGVDLKVFRKNEVEKDLSIVDIRYHISNEFFNLVFLGRLAKEKCVDTIFHAIQKLVQNGVKVHLYLIGNGPEKDNLINLTKFLGIEHNVSFLGFISKQDVVNVLNSCDLYIHPSQIELEGMSLLEAMACGLPIIVSDSPLSASKQFVDENGYTFTHGDSNDLAGKISNMLELNSQNKLSELASKSQEIAENYSFEACANRFDKLFSEQL